MKITDLRLESTVANVEDNNVYSHLRAISSEMRQELKSLLKEAMTELSDENKRLREALEFYAYPKHEDGDRAYIFGHEAREALRKIDEELK